MVWNLSATGKQHGYTDKDVAKIRELAATLPDHVVGERLGFHPRKVCAIRNAYSIPPCNKKQWPDEKAEQVRQLYVVQGLSADVVAAQLGCSAAAVRRLKERRGWYRDASLEARNRALAGAKTLAAKRAAERPPKPAPEPKRGDFSKAPVTFHTEKPVHQSLDERIIQELKERALSASSIASIIGEKEAGVGFQIAAMAHAGLVVLAEGEGRFRKWRAAAEATV
ncbi:hypothetical protein LJR164_001613 [Phenylobacterium sp. LjRoot164]|uniref:hypothetical protein n=1 Tax=unclassified Phenylobacterium TaxID=2640670 RepID=UPI003ECED3BE